MNKLSTRPAHRPGEELGGGAHRTERHYQDFVVDGNPLGPRIRAVHDCIGRLGWGPDEYRTVALAALLLEREPDFPGNRTALYVCPECGDLSCGTIAAVIERAGDTVAWRDFSYETEITPPITLEPLKGLGPFVFEWHQYAAALRTAAVQAPPDPPKPRSRWWERRVL